MIDLVFFNISKQFEHSGGNIATLPGCINIHYFDYYGYHPDQYIEKDRR